MTAATPTLADWLLACIAADEAVAMVERDGLESLSIGMGALSSRPLAVTANGVPCTAFDYTRVLAECEAKRRIVEEVRWRPTRGMECAGHPGPFMPHGNYGPDYCFAYAATADEANTVLRLLALPYADREGYREEWRA